jgi:transcriptional regulator with XRE-family HTH domain
MTGAEMKDIRHGLSEAIGRRLSLADMAKLCGVKDPEGNGKKTYRQWEEGEAPVPGPVAVLLSLIVAGIDRDFEFFLAYIERRLQGEA